MRTLYLCLCQPFTSAQHFGDCRATGVKASFLYNICFFKFVAIKIYINNHYIFTAVLFVYIRFFNPRNSLVIGSYLHFSLIAYHQGLNIDLTPFLPDHLSAPACAYPHADSCIAQAGWSVNR